MFNAKSKMENYRVKFKIGPKKKLLFFFAITAIAGVFAGVVFAATNIDSTFRYAWNDVIGWIDFYSTNNLNVFGDRLEGYADSPIGFIAFNCNTTPNGNICAGPAGNWRTSNDGNGNLSGWAWSDAVGWISMTCNHTSDGTLAPYNVNNCVTSNYQVLISSATGDFSGWAWNDAIGWISFNCVNTGTSGCISPPGSNYKVKTSWQSGPVSAILDSSVFDTGINGGAVLNSVMWRGILPAGTSVKIQIASSNCSNGATNPPVCDTGAWAYIGPGGAGDSYYSANPVVSMPINFKYHNNHRYFKYRVFLYSDAGQTQTPTVEDVIINYSP